MKNQPQKCEKTVLRGLRKGLKRCFKRRGRKFVANGLFGRVFADIIAVAE